MIDTRAQAPAPVEELKGLSAIVTGGSRGIGEATAHALARAGARVAIAVASSMEEAEGVAAQLRERGAESLALRCDVSNAEQIETLMDTVVDRWGGIDILINNAGIVDNAPAETMGLTQWQRMIDVNLTGVFLCAQAAGRRMIARGQGGAIVNVSSICGHIVVTPQEQCHYNAAKGGVAMLTKSLAAEWAEYGIRVNAVSPGYINTVLVAGMQNLHPAWTGRTPMGRLGTTEEIAEVIAFLVGPRAGFVTGSDWIADGGYVCW